MNAEQAKLELKRLRGDLRPIVERDSEQEVSAWALPVIDAVLSEMKSLVAAGDPVLQAITDITSVQAVENAEAIRAFEVYLVAGRLLSAIERAHPDPPLVG